MWSNKYAYYNIQSDPFFNQKTETDKVIQILLETDCFEQKNHQSFTNNNNFPWIEITLVETKDGNFHSSNKKTDFVNLIAVVCSKEKHINQQIYLDVFLSIAKNLNWKLYLEQDDEGNENIEIPIL